MILYVVRRLLQSVVVIGVVLSLVFIVTHLLGDPVAIALPPNATDTQIQVVRERLHLNEPLATQFYDFVRNAAEGSFGNSFWQERPALGIVFSRLPKTIYLALASIALIVPLGVGMGVAAALKPRSLLEKTLNTLSFVGISMVNFWLALMLILVFAVDLGWFPTSGYGGLPHFVLPVLTITILEIGGLAQLTRASVAEQLSQSYVRAARARGIPEIRVVFRHAVRNALIPVVTSAGGMLVGLLNGAIIAEYVFGWPGVGLLMLQSINQRDLPLLEACVFVLALTVAVMNLLVDLTYRFINPRVRLT